MPEDTRTLAVVGRREPAAGVVELTVADPAGEPLPGWEPGAHVTVHLAGGLARQYSLCGDPADGGRWRIAVLLVRGGRGGSAAAHGLAVGDRVEVGAPRNHFALVEAAEYVFVAGGIGITPLIPMVRAVTAAGRPWTLHYGGRTRESMAYAAELQALAPDRVHLHPQDERGLLDLRGALGAIAPGTAVYCCGPEPLLAAVADLGPDLPAHELRVERFAATEQADAGDDVEFEVELARSGLTLVVPPTLTVLEACEKAGVDIVSSCGEGICGTCETQVLEGTPDHRDDVLTDAERESNEVMMICVSRAKARLVLDL